MAIPIKDLDDVTTVHIPDRIEVDLTQAEGDVESLELKIHFKIKTILPSGKVVGEPYLDTAKPLLLNCRGNAELTAAMKVIQQAIGVGRYQQITAPPPEPILEPVSGPIPGITPEPTTGSGTIPTAL
ncbi:MAG: hypothetical protein M3N42_16165 [Cyanobacteriota bacterium]|nr:hypothetical protein [Cyanobacteriota bacterium]